MTDRQRWLRLQEVFETAVVLDPEERLRYVRRECTGDAALQAEVESLVEAERRSGGDRCIVRAIAAAARALAWPD